MRLAQARGQRGDLRPRGLLGGLPGVQRRLRLLQFLLRDHAARGQRFRAGEVGAGQRRLGLRPRELLPRGRELIGQVARPHQRQHLAALDLVAPVDQHRVEVAQRLARHLGLLEGAQVDGRAHLDRDVLDHHRGHRDQRRRTGLGRSLGIGLAAGRGRRQQEEHACSHGRVL